MNASRETVRFAVDVGGTFTDFFIFDEQTGEGQVMKVPSTPENPSLGVLEGVDQSGVVLDRVQTFSHGTTVATNALIEREYPRAAMVTTEGFRDVVEIGRGTKDNLWDAYEDVPPPYIPRRDRFEVPERIDAQGREARPLDTDAARELARLLEKRGYESIAICFVNSYVNPSHEKELKDLLAQELPDTMLFASHELVSEMFEHERFSTTMINALLAPLVSRYVDELGGSLSERGYDHGLLIFHSGGGVLTEENVASYAARLAGSGVAAGAIGGTEVARHCGFDNAITLDMGGTSADLALMSEGEVEVTDQWNVEYGYPIIFPSIDVKTIGSGGGSIAWIDEGGSLRVGPQSAGAEPGPASYPGGGDAPTTTDANLLLGRIGETLAGGEIQLDRGSAREALMETIGEPLGMDEVEAAYAIVRVANANMTDAIRVISIRRGHDPRDFALVTFGGAGPLHGVELARELSISSVLVPPYPGITSALGCLQVDIRHDSNTMFLRRASAVSVDEIESEFRSLEEEILQFLDEEGVAEDDRSTLRYIDMRYEGQWRSLNVQAPDPLTEFGPILDEFHREYERNYAYSDPDREVEIYQLRVVGTGSVPKPDLQQGESGTDAATGPPREHRPVYFREPDEFLETPIYDRDQLGPGTSLEGPAVVEQLDSTVLLPPDVSVKVDSYLNLNVTL